jgi:hypothetical protein
MNYTITKSKLRDPMYDSWHYYYEWTGSRWTYTEWDRSNESGMMGGAHEETQSTRQELTDDDCRFILQHFGLDESDVPIADVPATPPERLEGISDKKGSATP